LPTVPPPHLHDDLPFHRFPVRVPAEIPPWTTTGPETTQKTLTWPIIALTVLAVSSGAIGACVYREVSQSPFAMMVHPNEKPLVDAIIECDAKGWTWDLGKCWPPQMAKKQ
jgi:hypothetical protein